MRTLIARQLSEVEASDSQTIPALQARKAAAGNSSGPPQG
jgi:hypothetical protein